jgi:hypothetical protein
MGQWLQFLGNVVEIAGFGVMLWEWHASWSDRRQLLIISGIAKGVEIGGELYFPMRDPETKQTIRPGTPEIVTLERRLLKGEHKSLERSRYIFFGGAIIALLGMLLQALGSNPLPPL